MAKFDYDDIAFYQEVYTLAGKGLTDGAIAAGLSDKFGETLSPSTFSAMKRGRYGSWSDEENEKRSLRIREALERGRALVLSVVHDRYLKVGLGGIKVKSRTTVRRKMKIDGAYTDDEEIQTTETETELPPNATVLARYLFHHDPEWRKVERGEEEREETEKEELNIRVTFKQASDLELQDNPHIRQKRGADREDDEGRTEKMMRVGQRILSRLTAIKTRPKVKISRDPRSEKIKIKNEKVSPR